MEESPWRLRRSDLGRLSRILGGIMILTKEQIELERQILKAIAWNGRMFGDQYIRSRLCEDLLDTIDALMSERDSLKIQWSALQDRLHSEFISRSDQTNG